MIFSVEFGDVATYPNISRTPITSGTCSVVRHSSRLPPSTKKRLLALLAAYVLPKFEQRVRSISMISQFSGEHRRQGIATALINLLKHEANALGAYVIYASRLRDDPAGFLYKVGHTGRSDAL